MEIFIQELVKDPRSYALAVACYGWWSERQDKKALYKQMASTLERFTDALLALKNGA